MKLVIPRLKLDKGPFNIKILETQPSFFEPEFGYLDIAILLVFIYGRCFY